MINEIEALLGILVVIIIIYLFLWKRSKVIGTFALFFASLGLLIPFGNTNYELVAWIGIMVAVTSLISEFAFAKMGATQS